MGFSVLAGQASAIGRREQNEDFVGMIIPREPDLSAKGMIAAIAGGISGNGHGGEAAEHAVRNLLDDYYAAPDTWHVRQTLERIVNALHGWMRHHSVANTGNEGMATTLTALVLRGRQYYFSHVGDTRLYLLRDGSLTRLTTDHVWDRAEMQHVLTRAVGLDTRLSIDHGEAELCEGDIFLLASDGLWGSLSEYEMRFQLMRMHQGEASAEEVAKNLTGAALNAGSRDNVSSLVVVITELPERGLQDSLLSSRQLPVPRKLKAGQIIDGYHVESLLHASPVTLLYRVTEPGTQRALVLKTLHPDQADDPHERAAFAQEQWLAQRAPAPYFPEFVAPPQQNFLYYLTTWHKGETLQQQLDARVHFHPADALSFGMRLLRAIGSLHWRGIIHRDIKPSNILLSEDGSLRLLDPGVAQCGMQIGYQDDATQAGTPSFLAPEQFDHAHACVQTDLYAVGVTLYLMLTGHYPYGEIEAFQQPRFAQPQPPHRYRPDLPDWLEQALLKAVARNPADRFETAEEFLLALETGASQPVPVSSAAPVSRRDPVTLWRLISVAAIALNLLLLYLLVVR
jgi:serine/threonine protein phosphatase PrpC